MVRLLAVSDIHGNLGSVRDVRARERNNFDAIIVPGDIGDNAEEIFSILSTFECPSSTSMGMLTTRSYSQSLRIASTFTAAQRVGWRLLDWRFLEEGAQSHCPRGDAADRAGASSCRSGA